MNTTKLAIISVAVCVVVVLGLAVLNATHLFGFNLPVSVSTHVDREVEVVEPPTVLSLTPIDFGCKIDVEVGLELQGHERVRQGMLFYTQTLWTNTTEMDIIGDTLLCVAGEHTSIEVRDRVMYVTIDEMGVQSVSPRIVSYNGEEIPEGEAIGQKWADAIFFWTGDENKVIPLMERVAMRLIGDAACVQEAVDVLYDEVVAQYQAEAARHSDVDRAVVEFVSSPSAGDVDEANYAGRLVLDEEDVDDIDIDLISFGCNITEIDGQPAVG